LVSTRRSGTLVAVRLRILSVAIVATLIAPATASASVSHVVAAGESLSSIAAADGLTVGQLAEANGISPETYLLEGSTLAIPSQEAGTPQSAPSAGESASTAEAAAPSAGSYVVQPGDSLSAIAARAGMSTEELAAANGIDPAAPLLAGAVLQVPGGSSEAAPSAGPGAPAAEVAGSEPDGDEAEGSTSEPPSTNEPRSTSEASSTGEPRSTGEPPYPTEETVTPSQVGSTAEENGVPASLAEAIASQESGFNNNLTSSAGARGVMQIMPETWRWIGQELAGSTPLAPASAASNVRGGVLLLHSLLEATGGDPSLAAAGYFQGLGSVRQEGEAPETEQYVNNVLALRHQFGGE
jgi:LysM repeat protein